MSVELWRPIDGYNDMYHISNLGRVKSLKRNKELILSQRLSNNGYLRVTLCHKGNIKTHNIHQLVANAFICNNNKAFIVNHKDGNKTNNSVDNLEWCTITENIRHAFVNNLNNANHFKKTINQYDINDNLIKMWNSITEASNCLKIHRTAINNCLIGISKTSGGYKWRYNK